MFNDPVSRAIDEALSNHSSDDDIISITRRTQRVHQVVARNIEDEITELYHDNSDLEDEVEVVNMENRRLRSRLDGELAKTRATDRKLKRANREVAIYKRSISMLSTQRDRQEKKTVATEKKLGERESEIWDLQRQLAEFQLKEDLAQKAAESSIVKRKREGFPLLFENDRVGSAISSEAEKQSTAGHQSRPSHRFLEHLVNGRPKPRSAVEETSKYTPDLLHRKLM